MHTQECGIGPIDPLRHDDAGIRSCMYPHLESGLRFRELRVQVDVISLHTLDLRLCVLVFNPAGTHGIEFKTYVHTLARL